MEFPFLDLVFIVSSLDSLSSTLAGTRAARFTADYTPSGAPGWTYLWNSGPIGASAQYTVRA